jgi:hypothetical protein
MKILELLGGIYAELKTLNKNLEDLSVFNASTATARLLKELAAAADHHLEEKKQRERENPLRAMTEVEIFQFKQWINARIKARGISIDDICLKDGYTRKTVVEFLTSENARSSTSRARNTLSAALGYATFYDLVEDWRGAASLASKGGAA